MKNLKEFLVGIILILTTGITAGPWIEVGDVWLRVDIEYLSDKGIINAPITTWPLMWSNIKRDIDRGLSGELFGKLNQRDQNALLRLKRAFRKSTQKSTAVAIKFASDTEVLRGFADTPREDNELAFSNSTMGETWAYQLSIQYVNEPFVSEGQKQETVRYDGSYVAAIFGNYSLSYGYIEKWWGPGWDSSLILSNNARPSPGFMIQRNYSTPFDSKWLSWIGPWTFNAFANVLDDKRHINDAILMGMSVSFKPFESLEIGLRRTAQWGGDGRPESLSSLADLVLGRDNCGDSGIDDCGINNSNEPGNQLAGLDVKWRLPTEKNMSLYIQMMGEDEAGFFPAKKTYLFGFSSDFMAGKIPVKYYVEYSDTSTDFGSIYNVTYNHHIYQTGYRYQGRSIGSTYDNDTKSIEIGAIIPLTLEKNLIVQLSDIDISVDDSGKHTNNKAFTLLSAIYKQKMQYGQLELFLNQYSDIIDQNLRQDSETRLGATWKMVF